MTAGEATVARSLDDVGVAGEPTSGAMNVQHQIPQPPSAAPDADAAPIAATTRGIHDGPSALLDAAQREATMRRWKNIQAAFVDAPQQAVQDADTLVADLMQRLAQMFSADRQQLEAQWNRGAQVSTEDLRVSLQRYHSFFERLLSV